MHEDSVAVPSGLTTNGLIAKRYMARAVDSRVLMVLLSVVAAVFISAIPIRSDEGRDFALLLIFLPIWIAYGTVLESSPWQATIGKRVFGLRVYGGDGARLPFVQAAARNFIKDGPFFLLELPPGSRVLVLVWVFVHVIVIHRSALSQAIHDRVVHTWGAAPEETTQLHLA